MKTSFGLWVLTIAFAFVTIGQNIWNTDYTTVSILSTLQLIFIVIFVFWHGSKRYGLKGIVIFFFIVQIIGNIMENLSISTGFPAGHYYYSPSVGMPFLFQVPILAGIEYFAYGYLALHIATVLFGKVNGRINQWFYTIALPITSSFIMVMWDIVMDPINSTIGHNWIWQNGGGFNGVPLTNFLGWFLTTYLFYQIFAIYLRKRTDTVRPQESKSFLVMPVFLYLITAMSYVLMYVFAYNGAIADATGHIWDVKGIYETAAIMGLFTMAFPSFLALIKVFLPEE